MQLAPLHKCFSHHQGCATLAPEPCRPDQLISQTLPMPTAVPYCRSCALPSDRLQCTLQCGLGPLVPLVKLHHQHWRMRRHIQHCFCVPVRHEPPHGGAVSLPPHSRVTGEQHSNSLFSLGGGWQVLTSSCCVPRLASRSPERVEQHLAHLKLAAHSSLNCHLGRWLFLLHSLVAVSRALDAESIICGFHMRHKTQCCCSWDTHITKTTMQSLHNGLLQGRCSCRLSTGISISYAAAVCRPASNPRPRAPLLPPACLVALWQCWPSLCLWQCWQTWCQWGEQQTTAATVATVLRLCRYRLCACRWVAAS